MTRPARILVIDDDAAGLKSLRRALEKQGYEVAAYPSARAALHELGTGGTFDLVVTDLRMPEIDGHQVLEKVKELRPGLPVMLITAYGSEEAAFKTGQLGADGYIQKPIDLHVLYATVGNVLRQGRRDRENLKLAEENARLRRVIESTNGLDAIIGDSSPMVELKRRLLQVARSPTSVLIVGESGTGKELVARAIHDSSPRRERLFLPINCAAIPKDILESELFGHERGAFTGATGRKPGKFELASGGTLFLDEIGELPLEMQAKLLRVLEDKSFMRVGGVETLEVDVRIVAATNADLETLVGRGDFRADLYYRLKVVQLEIPPLRERPEDVRLLACHFLDRLIEEHGRPGLILTDAALDALSRQPWPGNVRELRNLLESAVVLSEGSALDLDAFPSGYGDDGTTVPSPSREASSASGTPATPNTPVTPTIPRAPASAPDDLESGGGSSSGLSMAEIEKRHIMQTLRDAGLNRTKAARVLGIGRRTLQRKLDEYREQGENIPTGSTENAPE